jgi:hypothetical protein
MGLLLIFCIFCNELKTLVSERQLQMDIKAESLASAINTLVSAAFLSTPPSIASI